jgi:hypothetical protein
MEVFMKLQNFIKNIMLFIVVLCLLAVNIALGQSDKMPITTQSKQALEDFLKGRDFFEKLQAQESLQYFEKAVVEDPNFAMGYLFSALAQFTPRAFLIN